MSVYANFQREQKQQIDYGAHRFAQEAAAAAAGEFLRNAQASAERQGKLTADANDMYQQAAMNYQQAYYEALITAYRTGAREALQMQTGDYSPYRPAEPEPLDLTWKPLAEIVDALKERPPQ